MEVSQSLLSKRSIWGFAFMTTFVTLGNATQPFERLLVEVTKTIESLSPPVIVQYGSTSYNLPNCDLRKFVSMETFEMLIETSDVLIMHGGAGSVIHAVRACKIPIVMPRLQIFGEHIDNHQLEFSIELDRIGKIIMLNEQVCLKSAIESSNMKIKPHLNLEEPKMLSLVRNAVYKVGKL